MDRTSPADTASPNPMSAQVNSLTRTGGPGGIRDGSTIVTSFRRTECMPFVDLERSMPGLSTLHTNPKRERGECGRPSLTLRVSVRKISYQPEA